MFFKLWKVIENVYSVTILSVSLEFFCVPKLNYFELLKANYGEVITGRNEYNDASSIIHSCTLNNFLLKIVAANFDLWNFFFIFQTFDVSSIYSCYSMKIMHKQINFRTIFVSITNTVIVRCKKLWVQNNVFCWSTF